MCRAKRRDNESCEKLMQLEEELRQIKTESGTQGLVAKLSRLQQERDKYKTECSKLRKDVAAQIESLKDKLTHAETRLEEKGLHTRKYAGEASRLLAPFLEQYCAEVGEEPKEIVRARGLLEKLQKSLATPHKSDATSPAATKVSKREAGVQAGIIVNLESVDEEDNQVANMRASIEEMKRGMKELEQVYESELARAAQEKRDVELRLKAKINSQESDLSAAKHESARLVVRFMTKPRAIGGPGTEQAG